MRAGQRRAWLAVILLALCATAAPGAEPAAEIRRLFDRINHLCAARKPDQLVSALGQHAAIIRQLGKNAAVDGRGDFQALTAQADLRRTDVASQTMEPSWVLHKDALAFCETRAEGRLQDGRAVQSSSLCVLHRTAEGWRIVLDMPCFVTPALHVGTLAGQDEAVRAGLREGDLVVACAGRKARTEEELAAALQGADAGAPVPLVVRRGKREETVVLPKPRLAVPLKPILVADPTAATEGAAVEEVKAVLRAYAEAARRRDVGAFMAAFSEQAFVNCQLGESAARVIGRAEFLRETQRAFASPRVPWEAFRLIAMRVVHKGPVALAQTTVAYTKPQGAGGTASCLHALVRGAAGWRIVANISAFLHLGPLPPAGDEEAIVRKLALDYVGAWNIAEAVPLDRIAAFLADDVEFVWSDGSAGKGKAQLLGRTTKALDGIRQHFARFQTTYDIRSIRLLPGGAVVLGRAEMAGRLKARDNPHRRAVWMTLIFERTPGGWRLVHEHSTRAAAPEASE